MALSEARRKWVHDHVATAVGRSEQQFKFLAMETAARRQREVPTRTEVSGELSRAVRSAVFFTI